MNPRLAAIARRQHALLTDDQCEAAVSRAMLRTMLQRGELERVRRRIYRVTGAPQTWEQSMMSAVLAGPVATIASHRAAGRIWRMCYCDDARIELTVPAGGWNQIADVVVHRSLVLESHCTRKGFIPVATPERTIIDLSRYLGKWQLARVIDDCLNRKLVTVAGVVDALDEIGSNGRRRTSILKPLLHERIGTDLTESYLERRTLRWLNQHHVNGFTKQHYVKVPRRKIPFRLDFAWPEIRVGVEPEGYEVHVGSRTAFDNGHDRRNALLAMGWVLLHVTMNTEERVFITDLRAALTHAKSKVGSAMEQIQP